MRRRFAVLLILGLLAISGTAFPDSDSDAIKVFDGGGTIMEPANEGTAEAILVVPSDKALTPKVVVELKEPSGDISDVIFSSDSGNSIAFVSGPNAAAFIPKGFNKPIEITETGEFQQIGTDFGVQAGDIQVKSDLDPPPPKSPNLDRC